MSEELEGGSESAEGEAERSFDMESALESIATDLNFTEDADKPASFPAEPGAPPVETGSPDNSKAPETTPPGTPVQPETPPAVESAPPKTWRPEAAKSWDQVPAPAQAEILKREEDMFKGLETYKADATIGKVMKDIVAPYIPMLQAKNIDPVQQIRSLLHSHHTLEGGTIEQKTAVLHKLAEAYGVSLGEAPYMDPQVQTLNKTIDELRSRLDINDNRVAETVKANLKKEVDTFAQDPAHPYFDEVATDIATLIRTKAASNLDEAYEKAIWMNPGTRAKETARLTAEAATKAQETSAEKAKAAAKATSANVKTSKKSGSGTAPVGSMDDTLNETLGLIKSRA